MEKFRERLTLSLKINIVNLNTLDLCVWGDIKARLALHFKLGHWRLTTGEWINRLRVTDVFGLGATLHDRLSNVIDCRFVIFLKTNLLLLG